MVPQRRPGEAAHGSSDRHAQSRAAAGAARAPLCRHGAHPALRGAGGRAVQGGRGQGHRAQLRRRGGDRGRRLRAPASGRLRRELPPRPRPLHRQRRADRPHDGRADGACHRLLRRARRLDARRRPGAQHPGCQRHRRRRHAAQRRRRARGQAQGRRSGGDRVLRRRRQQPGHLPRIAQSRGGLAAAGPVRLREQPVRAQHLLPADHRGQLGGEPRRRLRHPRRAHRRQRRARGARRDRRGGGSGAGRRGPEPDRGDDLALGPAQHARQPARPALGSGHGGLDRARSDPPVRRAPDRTRAVHRRRSRDAGRGREPRARRRGGVRRGEPGARRRGAGRRRSTRRTSPTSSPPRPARAS